MTLRRVLAALLLTAAVAAPVATTALPAQAATRYANCTALHKAYPHGVGKPGARDKVGARSKPVTTFTRNAAVYAANRGSDRDKDGIACEQR